MSNELVKANVQMPTETVFELDNVNVLVKKLMMTKHYQKIGEEGVYAVVAKAKALNIDPIHALNGGFYFVQGRVGMSTEMMASLVRQAGHSVTKDEKSTNTNCILRGRRKDTGDTWISSFSIEDAKRAGIYKDGGPWGKYPDTMCYNRAMSKLFRQLFPDLSQGAGYVKEELEEIVATEVYHEEIKQDKTKEISFEEKVEFISEEQQNELSIIFAECDPNYVEEVWKTLKKPPMSIHQLALIPQTLYDRLAVAARKNRDTYKVLQKELVADSEEAE